MVIWWAVANKSKSEKNNNKKKETKVKLELELSRFHRFVFRPSVRLITFNMQHRPSRL